VVGYVQAHRASSACQRHRAVVFAISDVNLPRGVDCVRQRCIGTLRELSEHATIKNHSAARPTSQPPALEAVNLSLGFGATTVLNTVSEARSAPAVTCLLAQAGSGKTTFLRALNRVND
jgi:ABC-type multidrug transport system fused ATPase/permease subunit